MEPCGRRGDANVGVHGQREADPHRDSVHARKDWFLAVDVDQQREVVGFLAIIVRLFIGGRIRVGVIGRLLEIETRAERVTVPRYCERPDVVVCAAGRNDL